MCREIQEKAKDAISIDELQALRKILQGGGYSAATIAIYTHHSSDEATYTMTSTRGMPAKDRQKLAKLLHQAADRLQAMK